MALSSTPSGIYPEREMVIALLANVNTAPVGGQAHRRIAAALPQLVDSEPSGTWHNAA